MSGRAAAFATILVLLHAAGLPGLARAQAADPPDIPARVTEGDCVVCHAQAEITETNGVLSEELYVTPEMIAGSVHAGSGCTDCHSPLVNTLHPDVDRAAESCAGCHVDQAVEHAAGAHGRPSEDGSAPTCITCHGNHSVTKADGTDFDEQLAVKCADCHTAMSERGFGANPLGMETHLGRADVATCDDCHEPHRVLPADDPLSSVHPSNKLETCQQCHEDAGPNFGEIQIHVANGPLPDDIRLRLATLWMLAILIFTFGFFGWLTVLGIRHEWQHGRHRRGHHPPPPEGGAS